MNINCNVCGANNFDSFKYCNCCGSLLKNQSCEFDTKIKALNANGNKFYLAEVAFEGQNYDEAINYYNFCLEVDPSFFEAWYKKGLSQLFSSKVGYLNSNQCVATLKKALMLSPDKKLMSKRISKEVIPFLCNYTNIIINHFASFGPEHISFMVSKKTQTTLFLVENCDLNENQLKILFEDYKNLLKSIKKIALNNVVSRGADKNNSSALYSRMYEEIDLLGDTLFQRVLQFDPNVKKVSRTECFIATATIGNYNDPIVIDLRMFRDEWLLKRDWGISFTRWYYSNGPKASSIIKKSNFLKFISLILIVKPLHVLSKFLMNTQYFRG